MTRNIDLKRVGLIGLPLLMFVFAACAPAAPATEEQRAAAPRADEVKSGAPAEPQAQPDASSTGDAESEAQRQAQQGLLDDRKVIRTADLTIVVDDTQTVVNQLRSLSITLGGYMAEANLRQVKDDLMQGTVTLRIDAHQFDEALDRIKGLALEVRRETIGSQDVSQEYTDLKSRLRNLEATEQELLALLSDIRKQTYSAEEILQVHRELTQVREDIEEIKGWMQYLDNRVSLATIHVQLIPKKEVQIVQPGWQPGQTLRDALSALITTSQGLTNLAIWLIVFALPVGVVIVTPVGLVVAGIRRWRDRSGHESAEGDVVRKEETD